MGRAWGRAWLALGLLLVGVACAAPQARTETPVRPGEIVILHTNDIHGNVQPVMQRLAGSDTPMPIGGSAALATFVARTRQACGDSAVLLLDAGDIFQGTPEGNEYRGRLSVDVMNRIGYDAATPGNHEFDYGLDNVKTLIRRARFPWFAENLRDAKTGQRPVELSPPRIIERQGVRIGLFGVLTEDLDKLTDYDPANGWLVLAERPAAEAAARILRDSGAEIVILISHCGVEHDSALAALLGDTAGRPRVDVIVGGHSHTRLDTPLVVNGVTIAQTGWRGTACGEVRIVWDTATRRPASIRGRLVDLDHRRYPPDTGIAAFLAPALDEVNRRMDVPVGRATSDITRAAPRNASSPLGNLTTDIIRATAGAEVAFQNKGGIRGDLPAGVVRLRELYTANPFGNTIVTVNLTGAQIREICEASLATGLTPLEVSGLTVYFDASRHPGDRVVNLFVGDAPIRADRTYLVATNNFLGDGGDNYPTFTRGTDYRDTGRSLLDVLVAWFAERPEGVVPVVEERWRPID